MGTNFAIGYERLLELFKDAQTNSPKGVGLKRKGSGSNQRIYLRFKLGNNSPFAHKEMSKSTQNKQRPNNGNSCTWTRNRITKLSQKGLMTLFYC